jgi:DNA-binding response OmpR family regulator
VILVIDPSLFSRRSIANHLAACEHDVVAVSTAAEALDTIDIRTVDVVLFDEQLTGPSSIDLIHVISESPTMGSVAIASPGPTFAGSMLSAGADAFIPTAAHPSDLDRAIAEALRAREDLPVETEEIEVGPVRIDRCSGRAWRGEELVPLSTQERRILQVLALRQGELVPMSDLRAELGIRFGLDRHAARLEAQLDPVGVGDVVESFDGVGLRLLG